MYEILETQNKILNDLINYCVDARDYYEIAIEKVNHGQIKRVFEEGSKMHDTIVNEMTSYISIHNGDIEENGTIVGKATQLFGQLKTVIQTSDQILIEELIKAEQHTIEQFENALNDNLPHEAISLIGKQIMRLKSNSDQLRKIKSRI